MKKSNNHQKPDFTAWFVLQGTIATMHLPQFYDKNNEYTLKLYELLSLEAGKSRLLSRAIQKLSFPLQYRIGEMVTNSGRLRHFYLRKKEIEKQTRKLLASDNIKQIIILGAGLDVLSIKLAKEFPEINFIEIDRAESKEFKKESFDLHNEIIPENLEFIPGDLRNPLPEILEQSKLYDPKAKTIWVAEGLFMFISEESVINIFKQIQKYSGTGSYCIFTTLGENWQKNFIAQAIQQLYMKKEKCPLYWVIDSKKVPEFVQKFGFSMIYQINCVMLHRSHINNKYEINHDIGDDIHMVKM